MMTLLAGATGLVGRKLLAGLLNAGHRVTSVGRRPTGIEDGHLVELTVDFANLPVLPPAETAICALGTTMKLAGSQQAFRAVDQDAVLAFFRAARTAGVTHAIIITAVGSDPDAGAFYSRVKGEVERDIANLGFARLDIIRPGLILGPRADRRPAEALFQALAPWLNPLLVGPLHQFRAIEADIIAAAIVALSAQHAPGRFLHGNRELRALAAGTGQLSG